MHVILLKSLLLAAWPLPSFAYLDPNLGGALFQWCLPLLLAIVAFWNYVRRVVSGASRRAIDWLRSWFGA